MPNLEIVDQAFGSNKTKAHSHKRGRLLPGRAASLSRGVGRNRLRAGLVVLQVALSSSLLVGTGAHRTDAFERLRRRHRHDVVVLSVLNAPAAEKGVGFLQRNHGERGRDSEQWLYLPALKTVKRILAEASGGPKRGHVFGSELAYEDLEQWHLEDFSYELIGQDEISGRTTWILGLVPTRERARKSSYDRTKMWIDQKSSLPLKIEAFKNGPTPVKSIHNRGIEKRNGVWLARETVVVNHESERMSRFETVSVVVNPEFPPTWSHERALEDESYRRPVFDELASQAAGGK